MALAEQQIVVRFAGGIDTKKDPKGVLPTKLLALENAVFTKEVSTAKRFGYEDIGRDVLSSSEPLPEGIALGRRGAELLSFSADQMHSRSEAAGKWVYADDVRSVVTSSSPVCKTGTNQTLADCCIHTGVALFAWEDSAGGTWYSLLDDQNGRVLVEPTQISASATRPRCVAMGDFLFLVYALAPAQELRILRFARSQPLAAPVESILLTDLSAAVPSYDIAPHATNCVIAWVRDTGSVGLGFLHSSGVIGGSGFGLPVPVSAAATSASAVAVCTNSDDVHVVVFADAGPFAVKYVTFDSDTGSFVARHAARTIASPASAAPQITCAFDGRSEGNDETVWIFHQVAAASPQNHQVVGTCTDVDASSYTVHDQWTQRGCGLVSRAFRHGEDVFVHVGRDSTLYRTYYTLRARGRLVCSRLLSGLGNGHLTKPHLPSVWFDDDSSRWFWAAIYVVDVDTPTSDVFSESGVRQVELIFESTEAFRSAESGATTYIAGGFLQAYDGQRVVEAEFHYGIDDVAAPTLGAPAGTGLADGTYGYRFVLENVLANGEIQRGPASTPVIVEVTGGPRKVTFAIPTYRLTAMPAARIGVYRSLDGDAAIYSRVSSFDPDTVGEVNGFVANDTTLDTVTFVDEMPDATLEDQDPLYTNGDIPSNDPLGGAMLVASGKGRLFVVDAADPLTLYYSQQKAAGYAVETTPELRLELDAHGGDITAVTAMDAAVVVFKQAAIFRIQGNGPLANPNLSEGGAGWSEPELVTSEIGCISPESVCQAPMGVVFQTLKGIYLLGRDWSVSYIGAPVEAYNGQTVRATTLIEDRTQIRFLTDSGLTLLYDYERGQWSTFTNHEGTDAILVGGVYHYLRRTGRTYRETTAYRDGNARIRQAIETAWINGAGHLQGLQRMWWATFIGEYKSAHKLRVYVGYDYQPGWVGDPILIDPLEGRDTAVYGDGNYGDGPYGGAVDTRYQFQIHLGQECEAIRFRFEDVEEPGVAGAAFELSEIHISCGVERSSFTVEQARSY